MMCYKKICILYFSALSICFSKNYNISCSDFYSLAILNSTLAALENISRTGFEENFFDKLLKKTINVQVRNRLNNGIEQIKNRSSRQQELAKYLLRFLFENEDFERNFFSGKFPIFEYKIGDAFLYADNTTDFITRILLALNIVQDIQNSWDIGQQVRIVSLGGGRLLQDYILLKALYFSGYTNLGLFVIDPGENHTADLKKIVEKDEQFKNLIEVEYYKNTYQFIKSGQKAINICYLVSPTGGALVDIKNVANRLKNGEVNWIRIGESPMEQIRFYFPYEFNNAFAKAIDKNSGSASIVYINHYLLMREEQRFIYVFGVLERLGKFFSTADDIMLDFYDIIKSSSLKHCFGYKAFQDTLTSYYNVKNEPYWTLNYDIVGKAENEIIWKYDPDKKQFELVN